MSTTSNPDANIQVPRPLGVVVLTDEGFVPVAKSTLGVVTLGMGMHAARKVIALNARKSQTSTYIDSIVAEMMKLKDFLGRHPDYDTTSCLEDDMMQLCDAMTDVIDAHCAGDIKPQHSTHQ